MMKLVPYKISAPKCPLVTEIVPQNRDKKKYFFMQPNTKNINDENLKIELSKDREGRKFY